MGLSGGLWTPCRMPMDPGLRRDDHDGLTAAWSVIGETVYRSRRETR